MLGFNSSDLKLRYIQQISRLANLPLNDLFVNDAGANVGEFTEVILKFQRNSKVLCIEPQEKLAKILITKFESAEVRVLPIGLGTRSSIVRLYFQEEGDRKASLSNQRSDQNFQLISIKPLSDVLKVNKVSRLHVLKLDLEGMDVPVLQSYFQSGTAPLPEVIILEVSFLAIFCGSTPRKTFDLLTQNGYTKIFRTSPFFNLLPIKSLEV